MVKTGEISPLVPLYKQKETFSRAYGWTPRQYDEQDNIDLLAYEAIRRGREAGKKMREKKNKQ